MRTNSKGRSNLAADDRLDDRGFFTDLWRKPMMFNTPRKSDWTGNNLGTLATEHVDGATATHQNDQATG